MNNRERITNKMPRKKMTLAKTGLAPAQSPNGASPPSPGCNPGKTATIGTRSEGTPHRSRVGWRSGERRRSSHRPNAAAGKPIRIVVVEDERLLAETLSAWLASDPRFQIAGEATNAQAGRRLCLAERPNVVLLDVGMPDGDGLTLAAELKAEWPDCRIVVLTGRVDPHTAWRAHQTGVHGLIEKTSSLKDLCAAICAVADGATFISPLFQNIREEQLAHAEAFYKLLSKRELEVLSWVTEGLTDGDIARVLKISEVTVACHRKNLRKKLELHDDRGLIAYGRKLGTFGRASRAGK